jgi:uncharacterized protein (TIGR03000 family)
MYSVVVMMALSGSVDAPDCHRNRCDGCYGGGCYGGGYGGCYGGGCYGGRYGGGCYGGGCYGGCYGGRYYGSVGGGYYGTMSYVGGYGSTGYGAPMYYGSTTYPGGYVYGRPIEGGVYSEVSGSDAPATILVRLPADAKLTVDGSATQSTDSLRTFRSPPLQAGKDYKYTLRAEVMRDGKTVERTRDVNVRAGQTSEVNFDFAK